MDDYQNLRSMINAGGASLVNLMRIATSNSDLAKALFSEKELSFLTDAAARARDFRDRLTPKQEVWAQRILSRPPALELVHALIQETERGESAKEPISEIAHTPPPATDYAADPEWGMF